MPQRVPHEQKFLCHEEAHFMAEQLISFEWPVYRNSYTALHVTSVTRFIATMQLFFG
jgi:hypothetical protein